MGQGIPVKGYEKEQTVRWTGEKRGEKGRKKSREKERGGMGEGKGGGKRKGGAERSKAKRKNA